MTQALLSVNNLNVSYGGIRAVRGLSLQVMPGETVALIGSNGAGKSSTLNALAGLVAASGDLRFDDTNLGTAAPHRRVQMGMALVPAGRGIFRRMTIHENLQLGAHHRRADTDGVKDDLQRMYALFPRLAERQQQLAGNLSGGEQQMLAMARALMSRPRLLLLDEPSMGLAPIIVDRIFQLVLDIASQGTAILLVEQNARRALQISQRAYVMESGEITLAGQAADLLHDNAVRRAYLGDD
jgi:branched-chain amino acid transport system ATP-binding protein